MQESFRIGGTLTGTNDGAFYVEKFNKLALRKFVKKLFLSIQICTSEGKLNLEEFMNLTRKVSLGQSIRKGINFRHELKTEKWMRMEYDDSADEDHNWEFVFCYKNFKKDEGVDEGNETSKK